jgi:hypothetical protein
LTNDPLMNDPRRIETVSDRDFAGSAMDARVRAPFSRFARREDVPERHQAIGN